MNGYYNKLKGFIMVGIVVTVLMWVVNSGILTTLTAANFSSIDILEEPINAYSSDFNLKGTQNVLVLYKAGDENSEKLSGNLSKVFEQLRMNSDLLDVSRKDTVSYMEYDMVVIASNDLEGDYGREINRVMDFVDKGGKLFIATLPATDGATLNSIYRNIGISDYGNYVSIEGLVFKEELMAGSKGMTFTGSEFADVSLAVQLEDKATVYVESENNKVPVIWSYPYGEGETVFYNATSSSGDYFTGMLGGCIMALYDDFMYPVINAKVIFLDDFPSMQYNSDSDVIKKDYNRTVKEFYRDIWWPDMQSAAKKYDLAYTGLFVATYDNIVDPDYFNYIKDDMEQYFGNSLLKNNFELGAHGYNHQSLTLEGGTPESFGYKAWKSIADMRDSLVELLGISNFLFKDVKLQTYVPPSNYLSDEGRQAVIEALPDLKVISGVYTNEGAEGAVYCKDFGIAQDGVAEFPRLTSGMLDNDFDDFVTMSGLSLYGVFSHFIHPDDILDEERGAGLTWQELLDNFCKKVDMVNQRFTGMRALTASTASDALRISDSIKVNFIKSEDTIMGNCFDYYGEAYFLLKTDKKPKAASASCTITPVTGVYDTDYYLVHITGTSFIINLED